MKSLRCFVLLVVVSLFLFVPPSLAKVTIKLAHIDKGNRLNSCMESFAATFKNQVESESRGEIEVLIYSGGQLGGMREMIESTQMGAIQMCVTFTSVATMFSAPFGLMQSPYVFQSAPVAYHVHDNWFGKELAKQFEKDAKMKVLSYGEANGFRQIYTNKRQIKKPEDFKGMRFRVPENKGLFQYFRAMGAEPVAVPWMEVYTAMKTGMVDGFEVELNSMVDLRQYETFKYATLSRHAYDTQLHLMNPAFFQSLSNEHKKIIMDAARVGTFVSRGPAQNNTGISLELIKSKGIQVYVPMESELAEFAKFNKVYLDFMEETVGKEWVDKLHKAIAEANQALQVE
jgi:tripartite ATP-independent transporter DctP family solute receptor